ncbi:unnamed protein product [Lactuca virosa]|uniref:Asparagine synthetase domain-containing protein n=1 Tax=Lactuca virosa TaxID=75947 RepID=A0AAU9M253_9ASTR|nr:unnamed protein product [Lactuca virosa]
MVTILRLRHRGPDWSGLHSEQDCYLNSYDVAMSIDPKWKMIQRDIGRIEKLVLRNAFDDAESPYLPKHILYRQKEQFSDTVGLMVQLERAKQSTKSAILMNLESRMVASEDIGRQCPFQPSYTECGYYVLKFMKAVVDEGLEVLNNNFWGKRHRA